jgi:hypothetical protein
VRPAAPSLPSSCESVPTAALCRPIDDSACYTLARCRPRGEGRPDRIRLTLREVREHEPDAAGRGGVTMERMPRSRRRTGPPGGRRNVLAAPRRRGARSGRPTRRSARRPRPDQDDSHACSLRGSRQLSLEAARGLGGRPLPGAHRGVHAARPRGFGLLRHASRRRLCADSQPPSPRPPQSVSRCSSSATSFRIRCRSATGTCRLVAHVDHDRAGVPHGRRPPGRRLADGIRPRRSVGRRRVEQRLGRLEVGGRLVELANSPSFADSWPLIACGGPRRRSRGRPSRRWPPRAARPRTGARPRPASARRAGR